jgi:hypothetical protein
MLKTDVAVLKTDVAVLKTDNKELKVKFLKAEGQTNNSLLRHLVLRLTLILRYRPSYGIESLAKFPRNACEFYKLRTLTLRQLALLIYLAKFYNIQGYET